MITLIETVCIVSVIVTGHPHYQVKWHGSNVLGLTLSTLVMADDIELV